MKESINVYTGDGSTLPTPELNQKLWPIEYDPALNIFVTKDINGFVLPVGGGGTPPITMQATLSLSSAEILTMGTTPIVALPAVANKSYIVHLATLETTNAPGTGYTVGRDLILITANLSNGLRQTKFNDVIKTTTLATAIGEIVKGKKDENQYKQNENLLITTQSGSDPVGGDLDFLLTIFYSLI